MSNTKKILSVVFSLLFIAVLGFTISWCVINFNQVKDGMSGNGVYTVEDLNHAYEDGYSTALTDKEEYEGLINGYRNTIIALNDTISQLNSQVNDLTNNNRDYSTQIQSLTEQKAILEQEVENLNKNKAENQATIKSLNTIIFNLNQQISEMSLLTQNYTTQINTLNNRINELQTSINYYESYIATLENSEQVVATFEYDGSVYAIQIVNKGAQLSVTNPENTETKIFNGWKVDTDLVDLNDYRIVQNTKFIADITYRYTVKFWVDSNTHSSQVVSKNETVVLPQAPEKDGYEFIGWSLNGVDVVKEINKLPITTSVTYHAVFIKVHTVTFIVDGEIIDTQVVRNGEYAKTDNITNQKIKGWQLNDTTIDVATYRIFANTSFVADLSPQFSLQATAWNGLSGYFQKTRVWNDGINCYYSDGATHYQLDITTHTWSPVSFYGLTKFYGYNIWSDGTNYFHSSGSDQYKLNTATRTWEKMSGWYMIGFASYVWTDGTNYYYSQNQYYQYKFNPTNYSWDKMTWNGLTDFSGGGVWTEGNDIYYGNTYRLDLETNTWVETSLAEYGLTKIDTRNIWTDGNNYYYSNSDKHYQFDGATKTLKEISFGEEIKFSGDDIWTDGINYYVYLAATKEHYAIMGLTS